MYTHRLSGFTLLELLLVLALIGVASLAAVRALNPAGQIASARNSQRTAHVNALVNVIRTNINDGRTGKFICAAGDIPTTTMRMASGPGNYDIAPCLVPTYITVLPFDPSDPLAHYVSNADYDTGYMVVKNASSGQITVSAPSAELGATISVTR